MEDTKKSTTKIWITYGLAGFLLGFIEIFVATIFPSTMRNLIAFGIILIILTFRPHGFFGEPYSAQLRL